MILSQSLFHKKPLIRSLDYELGFPVVVCCSVLQDSDNTMDLIKTMEKAFKLCKHKAIFTIRLSRDSILSERDYDLFLPSLSDVGFIIQNILKPDSFDISTFKTKLKDNILVTLYKEQQ